MPSEWLLPFTALVNLAVFALVALVFAISFAVRLQRRALEHARARVESRWRPLLVRCAAGEPVSLPGLSGRRNWIEWMRLWNAFHGIVEGRADDALNALAVRMGLPERLPRLLHRDRETRLRAIESLGHLRHPLARTLLPPLVRRGGAAESIAAADALARALPEEAVELIVPLILERPEWTLPRVATVLSRLEQEHVCARLLAMIDITPEARLPGLLRLIGSVNCTGASEAVWQLLLTHDDPDVVAPALALLHDPKSVAVLYGLMLHENWVVRMNALLAIGRAVGRQHLDFVLPMLRDENWWVRYRAAQAVASICRDHPEELGKIRAAEEDPYARDMLDQVIAELSAA